MEEKSSNQNNYKCSIPAQILKLLSFGLSLLALRLFTMGIIMGCICITFLVQVYQTKFNPLYSFG